jgi:hypothetical protein
LVVAFRKLPEVVMRNCYLLCLFALSCNGCAVVAVADAAITVVATTVSVGATIVGTTVDVAAAGVSAAVGSDKDKD